MFRILCFSFMILPLLAGPSSATIWEVAADGTGDAPNIQAAIDSCSPGDTVLVGPGTYKGSGNRDVDFFGKAILVTSSAGAASTIIDCEGSGSQYHRGFYFHSGEDTTSVLRGLTITNGYSGDSGGAICCIASSPSILDNVVTANYAQGGGGGLYCQGTHSIISGNTISHNEVPVWLAAAQQSPVAAFRNPVRGREAAFVPTGGGNICCIADSSLLELNTITGGLGTIGSAILCNDSSVRVRHNDISENGGVYTEGTVCFLSGSYDIEANTISQNTTWHNGSGIYCSGGTYLIAGNTIRWNHGFGQSSAVGGGLYCGGGSYTILDNDIIGNWTPGAGGIYIEGSGSIRGNRINGNETAYAGPCKTGLGSSSSLTAGVDVGGGITIVGSSSLLVANNIITGNSAPFGSGIACFGSNPEITDNTIANNGAHQNPCGLRDKPEGRGGGIYCENSSPIIARNTIFANTASDDVGYAAGAGIFCASASSPVIHQNILVSNAVYNATSASGIYCEDSTSIPSISYNDVYDNANANYGGTLADQTGLGGNFSLDPIFCDAENGDLSLHILSPCVPGNHPGGEDYGLVGAMGPACEYIATLLQGYSTSVSTSAVTITWTLAQAGKDLTCSILRAEGADEEYREIPSPGIMRDGMTFTFNDEALDPGTAYRYRVDVADNEGTRVLFETSQITTPALPLGLDQNFPNPFNPSTTIFFYLPEDSPVTLSVYDVAGRRIADLVGKAEKKGRHSVTWNGMDEKGSSVASGIYFSKLTAGKETVSKKMILLR